MRIYIAEDDSDQRAWIAAILRSDGHEVVAMSNGAEMLTLLEQTLADPSAAPDVVIVDVLMPEYSGLGVLKAVRTFAPAIPVIVMSAFREPSVGECARQMGAFAFLRKPVAKEQVRIAVLEAGDRARARG